MTSTDCKEKLIEKFMEENRKLRELIQIQQFSLTTIIRLVADEHGMEKELTSDQRAARVLEIIKGKYPVNHVIQSQRVN